MKLRLLGSLDWVCVAHSMRRAEAAGSLRGPRQASPCWILNYFLVAHSETFIVAKCVMKGFCNPPRFPTVGLKNPSPRWNTVSEQITAQRFDSRSIPETVRAQFSVSCFHLKACENQLRVMPG